MKNYKEKNEIDVDYDWNMQAINAENVNNDSGERAHIKVAVLDSGERVIIMSS